ncbi:MAG: RnfABCDGE type electron transport complex subunit G [Nitrospirae bacterium]|nr:RnfABCDGE type electron transport complex subunit G [Nitrospirota bacterium]
MNDVIKITMSLVVIFVCAGLIMAGIFSHASPVMYWAEVREKEEALKKMAPEAERIDEAGKWFLFKKENEYFEAKKGDNIIGYIASSIGKGYSSYIKLLISVDNDLKIKSINVLRHGETPGLGDVIESPEFKDQFKGKGLDQLVLVKGETKDKIQAVTGATISSRAVTNGVKDAVKMLHEKYGKEEASKKEAE